MLPLPPGSVSLGPLRLTGMIVNADMDAEEVEPSGIDTPERGGRGGHQLYVPHLLRAKDPKVRCARVCIMVAGLVLQGIAGSKHWPLDALV